MSTNRTENYHLNQWEHTDKVLMDDFNTDNAKIDAALAGKADRTTMDALARTVTGHTSELGKKGNCQLWTASYTGDGRCGSAGATIIDLPARSMLVFIASNSSNIMITHPSSDEPCFIGTSGGSATARWSNGDTKLTISGSNAPIQMNNLNQKYFVFALIDKS